MHVCSACEYCTVTVLWRKTEQLWILLSQLILWNETKRLAVIPATMYSMMFFFAGVSWEKEMPNYDFHTSLSSLRFS